MPMIHCGIAESATPDESVKTADESVQTPVDQLDAASSGRRCGTPDGRMAVSRASDATATQISPNENMPLPCPNKPTISVSLQSRCAAAPRHGEVKRDAVF